MLNEKIKKYRSDDFDLSCSESILYSANEEYNLGLSKDVLKMMAPFSGGLFREDFCGIIAGSLAVLGLMFTDNVAHQSPKLKEVTAEFLSRFEDSYSNLICKDIKSNYRDSNLGCDPIILKGGEILDDIVISNIRKEAPIKNEDIVSSNVKSVNIYTDGGCAGNQSETNIGGWGALLEYGDTVKELYSGTINTTNNIMEMTAVIQALKAINSQNISISIFSDSAYVVNCFRQAWYKKWQSNGWLNSKKEAVENKELWMELISLVESFSSVTFYKIKGHLDIDKKSDVTKWFKKFNDSNKLNFSKEDFLEIVKYNHKADLLANKGIDDNR